MQFYPSYGQHGYGAGAGAAAGVGGVGGVGMGGVTHEDLVQKIKAGQRASQEWKERWWNWCEANGGTKDPAKLDMRQLSLALSQCGEPPAGPLGARPMGPGQMGAPRHQGGGRMGGGGRMVGGRMGGGRQQKRGPYANNPRHVELTEAIKRGQRLSPQWKQEWWKWCAENGTGINDPARHPLEMLEQALQRIGDPPLEGSVPPQPTPQATGPEHQLLIDKVKTLQRTQHAFKIAWGKYCDEHGEGSRDPVRHDIPYLQTALQACIVAVQPPTPEAVQMAAAAARPGLIPGHH